MVVVLLLIKVGKALLESASEGSLDLDQGKNQARSKDGIAFRILRRHEISLGQEVIVSVLQGWW